MVKDNLDNKDDDNASPYEVQHFINGRRVSSQARKLEIYNPAQGQVVGFIAIADQALVDQAVKAAEQAFTTWSHFTALQRAKILFRFRHLLENNRDQLIELIVQEHGKTKNEAQASLQRGMDVVDFACSIANPLKGSYASEVSSGVDSYSLHQPLGVCVGITPFNFPAMIPLWMFPLAIACGNTFILKPSEKNPSCALRLVELIKEAGIPDGVVNLVHGDKETVNALITHEGVNAVSFVGSSLVAESVYQTATHHGKRVQAFGGAKNHCLVMPDADLDQAAQALVTAAYDCAGERCMAISVVVVVGDKLAEQLISKMHTLITHLNIGCGLNKDVQMGPLITQQHLEKVKAYLEIGKQEGAVLLIDGSQYRLPENEKGFFMGGCLFDYVTPSMRIYKEEIFGPVLSIVRVNDFETGLKLINEHEYGNGTAIFTSDGYTAKRFCDQVQVGMVGVNVAVPVPFAYHSFGGWKRSVFSDVGMYGSEAVRFYTKLKTVTQRWFAKGKQS